MLKNRNSPILQKARVSNFAYEEHVVGGIFFV